MRLIFFFSLFCLISFHLQGQAALRPLDELQNLSKEDRVSMERFFQVLLYEYEFGYTLFGKKPASMAFVEPSLGETAEDVLLEKGWEVWTRFCRLLPDGPFLLKKAELFDGETTLFLLINQPLVLRAIVDHLDIFRPVFNEEDPEEILKQICHADQAIFKRGVSPPQAVIGILLGYGKENALHFQHEGELFCELDDQITPPLFIPKAFESLSPLGKRFLKGYGKRKPQLKKNSSKSSALLEEAKESLAIRRSFELTGGNFPLERFTSPRFACWGNTPETLALRQSYETTRIALREAYRQGSFLEVTLTQWISSPEKNQ